MARWIGVDYGRKRIGLAVSDAGGEIASPAKTLASTGNASGDADAVLEFARHCQATALVVGMPLNMDGSSGPQAAFTNTFVEQLRAASKAPVETWDERLTSFQADLWMSAAGLTRAQKRKRRDPLAAQAILQSFLDAHNSAGSAPTSRDPLAD